MALQVWLCITPSLLMEMVCSDVSVSQWQIRDWRHCSTFSLRSVGWIYLYSFISPPPPQLHVDTTHSEQNNLNTKHIAGGLTELLLEAVKKSKQNIVIFHQFFTQPKDITSLYKS